MRLILCAVLAMTLTGYDEPEAQTMCFKSGEEVSRMNKICYYRCLSGTVAINIKRYEICPLSIDR